MILPPRPQNQRRPDRPRPPIDLVATVSPLLPPNLPPLDRFAAPPWNRGSPEWIAIDDDRPVDHLARAIDAAVDQLDLSAVFASSRGVGSPAPRPDLMLKIVLDEMQTGRHSPDHWASDVRDRRCLQWLGWGITPSRTRCYAFRDRLGPLLKTGNRQVLESAGVQGITTAQKGSLDGSTIAAKATRHRLVNLSRRRRHWEELDRVIAADTAGQDPGTIPGWMARSPKARRRQRHRFGEARRKLLKEHARNARRPRDQRQDPEKIVISTSDPQAALGRDKGKVFRPLYTLEVVQDTESPLGLGYEVFAQATDAGTVMPLRPRAHDLTGIWLKEILADSGYASALDLFDCSQAGVDLYPPSQENDWTEPRRAQQPPRPIPKSQFVWQAQEHVYVCPQGHRRTRISQETRDRAEGRTVEVTTDRCPKQPCQACPLARRCTGSTQGRTIKRNEHEDLIAAHQAKMQTPEAKAIYRQRCRTVEWRFADAKEHRGLRRFRGRGLEHARIEVGLCVLVHNRWVVRAAGPRKAAEGQNGTSCQDAA
jgi:transposase